MKKFYYISKHLRYHKKFQYCLSIKGWAAIVPKYNFKYYKF